jgi:hypothetical protein
MRDKHHAHDLNDLRDTFVGAVLDGSGRVLGIAAFQGLSEASSTDFINARILVREALAFVRAERTRLDAVVLAEVEGMMEDERLALPRPAITRPSLAKIDKPRRQGPARRGGTGQRSG